MADKTLERSFAPLFAHLGLKIHLIASDIEALRDITQELSDRLVRMQHQRSRFDQG